MTALWSDEVLWETALHSVFTHLEKKKQTIPIITILFDDFRSAFNIPIKLMLEVSHSANWYWTSSQTTNSLDWRSHLLHSSAEHHSLQGCVFSPLSFTLYTHVCNPWHGENLVWNPADDGGDIHKQWGLQGHEQSGGAQRTTYCSTSTKQKGGGQWF